MSDGARRYPKQQGMNFQVRRDAQAVRDLAKEMNVPLLDVLQLFENPPGGMSVIQDGCHPHAQGHALIAEATIKPVVELLRDK